MFAAFSRAEVSPFRDAATIASLRALTRRMSTPISPSITTPYSAARRAIRAAWALATKALVGVQPVLTQVPPMRWRSTTATFIPAPARRNAKDGPAWPVPMMIASKSGMTCRSSRKRRYCNKRLLISFYVAAGQGAASTTSKIESNVTLGLAAADQQIARRRRLDWVRLVDDGAGNQPRLAVMTNSAHDQRTGTSHASASSSRLWKAEPQWTERLLRVKDTSGPTSAASPGGCGGHCGSAAMPGVIDGPDPKFSVCRRSWATPQPARPSTRPLINAAGPQM